MPHGIPLGQPDRFIEFQPYSHDFCDGLPRDLAKIFHWHSKIGVHHRPKRNRYTIAGKPISRRTIDRLVYFGVIDETELQNGI